MREFMIRGGAISVDHLSELHRAADDLTTLDESLRVPVDQDPGPWPDIAGGEDDPLPFAGPRRAVGGDLGPKRIGHAGPSEGHRWASERVCEPSAYPALPPERRELAAALDDLEVWGVFATLGVDATYAAAQRVMAEVPSLPLAGTEPWVESDWPFWRRLIRGRSTAECEALWDRWSCTDEDFDDIGLSLGLPRTRLVLASPVQEDAP